MIGRLGKIAALLLVACVGVVTFGATVASAETFTVDTLLDQSEGATCEGLTDSCTLRHAMERVNEAEFGTENTIEFAVEGVIHLNQDPLPPIFAPTTIDATTLPGYEGEPLVEVDGSEVHGEGGSPGIEGYADLEVYGLAIGGFEDGIVIADGMESRVCDDYIGVQLDGSTPRPNQVGIETRPVGEGGARSTRIGTECGEHGGNLISGNEIAGVLDHGSSTYIGGNEIGVDAFGNPLANGGGAEPGESGGGVVIAEEADAPVVGVNTQEPSQFGAPNEIAYNVGAGVWNTGTETETWVLGNSIHDNQGLGIRVEGLVPPAPVISGFSIAGAEAQIEGTVSAEGPELLDLEYFASEECDSGGAGEGEFFLGSDSVEATEAGEVGFDAVGLQLPPPGATVITATSTGKNLPDGSGAIENTSEFSTCFALPAPPPPPPGPPPGEKLGPTTLLGPTPVNGKTLVAAPTEGTIKVKVPGSNKYVDLSTLKSIPSGSIIDATKGKVTITSVNAAGEEQTATFYGGVFQVKQKPGATIVLLILKGGNFKSCKAGKASPSSALASGRAGRHLWGSGKGHFKTEGNHGSATVRGTIWFTEDRCSSTFFKVKRGVVSVRDFDAHRTISLKAGKTYTAGP